MDELYWRSHVPAFGSWDFNDDLPFTQCFESALRYSYSDDAGDLYPPANAIILVRGKTAGYPNTNKQRQRKKDVWECESENEVAPKAKAVDEDLYKISPHILRQHNNNNKTKRGGWGIFSRCLRPTRVC